jgi:Leucine-rich repeat (LRR) protein
MTIKFFIICLTVFILQFAQLAKSLTLTCDFKLSTILKRQQHYKCIANKFDVQSPGTELNAIIGEHQLDKSNADIGILIIENQKCHYLPVSMQIHFPNVYHLDIRNSSLRAVTQDDLGMFPHLKYVYLRQNLIEILPQNLFAGNKMLQFINLNDNRIKSVAANVFDNLPELVSIAIERNVCINEHAMQNEEIKSLKADIAVKCMMPHDADN